MLWLSNGDNMELTKKQKESIRLSNSRLNIWEGSVRSGKSFAVYFRFLKAICEPNKNMPSGTIDISVGKTLASLKRNAIDPMIDLLGSDNAYYLIGKQEFWLFDRPIYVFSANDERSADKIQGCTVRKVLGDELSLWPESFFSMLDTRLSTGESQLFGSTNTDAPNHYLKTKYIDREKEIDISRFHFCLDDNTTLNENYKIAIKKNCTGLWYDRYIKGLWSIADGVIFDFFDPNEHTLSRCPIADTFSISIDYGTVNPFACILFGENSKKKPRVWAEDEYYYDSKKGGRQKTDKEYAKDIIAFCQNKFGEFWREKITHTIIDPSAASFKQELFENNFPSITDADNSVDDGLRLVASMLKSGYYAISEKCENYIKEFSSYTWNSKIKDKSTPNKENDHCQDAGRYKIQTDFGGEKMNYDWLTGVYN